MARGRISKKRWILIAVLCITVGGVSAWLIIPIPTKISSCCSTDSLMISRAEACNMGIASFMMSEGRAEAIARWNSTASEQERYEMIQPHLAYAPDQLNDLTEHGYRIELPGKLGPAWTDVSLLEVKEIDY